MYRPEARRKRAMHIRSKGLERLAHSATVWAGTSLALALATLIILVWLVLGPFFRFSNTWQLVINTSTSIVTFLMVFLIQRSQNKEAQAMQLKLNELIAAVEGASARLINVEDFSEQELETLHRHYALLAQRAKEAGSPTKSHSVEEAERRHRAKHRARNRVRRDSRKGASSPKA
jgi:low affinity Fe/Cu permease